LGLRHFSGEHHDYVRIQSALRRRARFSELPLGVVQPVCFAAVYWDGPGDTLFSFEDQEAFKR
jgi:hypothetical protein